MWLKNSEDFELKFIFIEFLVQKAMFYSVYAAEVGMFSIYFLYREKSRKKKPQTF